MKGEEEGRREKIIKENELDMKQEKRETWDRERERQEMSERERGREIVRICVCACVNAYECVYACVWERWNYLKFFLKYGHIALESSAISRFIY